MWFPVVLLGACSLAPVCVTANGQTAQPGSTATQSLLDKAHALEVRGRMDMASQTWQQVLLADPNNTEALGGLARAAKLSGDNAKAGMYLDRLRAINPNDPGIAKVENMGAQADHNAQLQQAGKLAQQGQYAQAMNMYRQVYGNTPPPGDAALGYYETEAATEEGRPAAIAGLRGLVEKFPSDSRYQIALGRILTYNPKTRPEGRAILEKHPSDPQATEALRQSLLWDSQNPATAGEIRAYLSKHNDQQLTQSLRSLPKQSSGRNAAVAAPLTDAQRAAAAVNATRNAEDNAAYKALNAKHIEEAETRFKAILAKSPDEPNALAGMGYIRMQQQNFGGAISFLVQAKQDGSKDPGLDNALATSRFFYTLGEGAIALNENDLPNAEKNYRAALVMRPNSQEALEGLGGTLLKAQQPQAAVPYFVQFVKVNPAAPHAWRGLFLAEFGSGDAPRALATERQIPPKVRAELARDPLFLRSLSSAYSSVGRDADAQRVLKSALDLPFPADSRSLEADTQLQYAGLLVAANRLEQAAGLYRQVLAKDQNNTGAWQGLVRVEHAMDQDQQALQTIESMPPASYAQSMRDTGFEQTVASIYQGQRRLDVAQDLLEKAVAQQTTAGQKPSVTVEVQLAGIYLQRDNPQQAYPLYQRVLTENPNNVDAWKGLLSALHDTGRDQEALSETRQIPAKTKAQLELDVDYLQTVGSIYNGLGQPQQAEVFLHRVQQHYAAQNALPPVGVDVQNAYLLYNIGNDQGLYRQLMMLGDRSDLSEAQRRTVQTLWTNWAVRRANQAAVAGNNQKALAILNATARAFPGNPEVIKALAGGYARAGMPKEAVMIWKAQDLNAATPGDYKAAVGAALAANDTKDAETWLRFGLNQYPRDPELLILGAKFEQARGDNSRAADYYRASLGVLPKPDPGTELATELSRPVPLTPAPRMTSGMQSQDLAGLLQPGPGDSNSGAMQTAPMQPANGPLYLPSYNGSVGGAPVPLNGQPAPGAAGDTYQFNQGMPAMTPAPSVQLPSNNGSGTTLRDYRPQSYSGNSRRPGTLERPMVHYASYSVGVEAMNWSADAVQAPQQSTPQQTTTPQTAGQQGKQTTPATQPAAAPAQSTGEVYGPYVPYTAPAPVTPQLGTAAPAKAQKQPEVTDVLPSGRYVPNAKTGTTGSRHPDVAAANAAAARRRQSNPESRATTGQSHPPDEQYNTAPTEPVQYTGQPYSPAQGVQTAQPGSTSQQQPVNGASTVQQTGDSFGQQYPQPNTRSNAVPATMRGRARSTKRKPNVAANTAPLQVAAPPVYQGLSYPGVGQALTYQPYPTVGPAYPLGVAPSDQDLMARRLPPLRGPYYTGPELAPQVPLTERQQTELDLATLEASYSGWLGGTGSARYRSGTPGIDRLTDLEATFEASATVGNNVRLTVVPRAVFLNSGLLNTAAGTTTNAVLGTLSGAAVNPPQQQFASGVGGELQVSTRNFAGAVGYTPYNFLVQNVTGRVLFKPDQHFTLYADRSPVTETQLSYAGLHDPGQATLFSQGPIWGGVISTGGGVRFDYGDERAGFYITADGADLTGYHVLENNKFEGSAGAYFLAHTFPGVGRLNIGASMFGMHYAYNERGETYGLGGYFSPTAYFLASVPVTFTGQYHENFHYSVAGALGVQTFQEASQNFFPLDASLQNTVACTLVQQVTRSSACVNPVNSNTGGNYSINMEGAYRIADHWFAGGFLSANNTNNYNTVTGGFFIRYLFRRQFGNEEYPTGLFPVEGFRPLRVP